MNYDQHLAYYGTDHNYENLATPASADREWVQNVADADPERCRCRGNGWILSDRDVWYTCPAHNTGQTHPEDAMYEEMMEDYEDDFDFPDDGRSNKSSFFGDDDLPF